MKRIITLTWLCLAFISLNAQNKVGMSFAQNISTLRFVDSEGNKDDLDLAIKYGYALGYQFGFYDNFFADAWLGYNTRGANSTEGLQKLAWSLGYVNATANAGDRINLRRLLPHFGIGAYYGRLLTADQYIGSDYYDLMDSDVIHKNDVGAILFAGLEYKYSLDGAVFIRFSESVGLLNLETDKEASQKMFNRTFAIQVGLFFSIK